MPRHKKSGAVTVSSARKKLTLRIKGAPSLRKHKNATASHGPKGRPSSKRPSGKMSSLNNSTPLGTAYIHSTSVGDDVVRMRGREVIGTVFSATAFTQSAAKLFPSDTTLFPRLSAFARCYQKYRFTRLTWRYYPMVPATTAGTMGCCFQTDSNVGTGAATPSSMMQYPEFPGGAVDSVCYPLSGTITFDREFPWFDLRSSNDQEMSTWCTLFVARDGSATANSVLGYVALDYEIELKYLCISSGLALIGDDKGTNAAQLIRCSTATSTTNLQVVYCPSELRNPLSIGQFMTRTRVTETASPANLVYGTNVKDLSDAYAVNLEGYSHGTSTDGGYLLMTNFKIKVTAGTGNGTIATSTNLTGVAYQDKGTSQWVTVQGTFPAEGVFVSGVCAISSGYVYGICTMMVTSGTAQYSDCTNMKFSLLFQGFSSNITLEPDDTSNYLRTSLTRIDNSDPFMRRQTLLSVEDVRRMIQSSGLSLRDEEKKSPESLRSEGDEWDNESGSSASQGTSRLYVPSRLSVLPRYAEELGKNVTRS